MKKLHLVCNAHLDPVWQWEWEEGCAAAISTFRVAADFCEEFDGFVFNHNEAILYRWIEEYEPELFSRIQKLVKNEKWHIMGGWYLQPDCNMPSGESFVRQILIGKQYFMEKFGVEPTTAINFDPFGHSRGLVQIMKKSGYDSYVFCRPNNEDCPLPSDDFTWVGFDGSEIMGFRASDFYNSAIGTAGKKVLGWIERNKSKSEGMVLWGIGNHGGGPSKIDTNAVNKIINECKDFEIVHSTPEAYFKELKENSTFLPKFEKSLNAWAIGCYTSQIRIKQKHRLLENELFMLEKMLSSAAIQGYLKYNKKDVDEAFYDLMTSEFHDALPGSSIQNVEEAVLRTMEHGLEIVSRHKAKAFFALASGQKKAKDGEIPILIYNPHPFKVKGIFECEFSLADVNWGEGYTLPTVYQKGQQVFSQTEKELSNISLLDWRKRIAFSAELEPSQMNRFDCTLEVIANKPEIETRAENNEIIFKTNELEVVVNCKTGLIDKYRVDGIDYLEKDAFLPLVIEDDDDSWGTLVKNYRNVKGKFELMSSKAGTEFSGVHEKLLDSVRVIEDGKARTVIEAVFAYGSSFICQTYKLPKIGTEIQVQVRVHWNEKSTMLKLSVPTVCKNSKLVGQVAYGVEQLIDNGNEAVSQKWLGIVSEHDNLALTCINEGVYGADFKDGELRISLLRSPGYCAHPIGDGSVMPQDRYSMRIDQGERLYNFWFNAGNANERFEKVDREALVHNEKPFALSFFPSGAGIMPKSLVVLSDEVVLMTAFKKAEASEDYIIRLFEPTGKERSTVIEFPVIGLKQLIKFGKFEIKSFKLNIEKKTLVEVDLLER
ncbi:MAG: alpha-mannosidase [Vallitaleaceae bacterium]|nr:alpha-mannosidase [Vallitaleaceae bacterium]